MRSGYLAVAVVAATGCGFQINSAGPSDATIDGVADDGSTADGTIDGSPDLDTDGDGFTDAVDNCVGTPNPDQRDWDQDARGDVCDGCPHLAAEGGDGDGDGLPDACDPRPATPGDSQLLWRGFYDATDITDWSPSGGAWSVANGMLAQTTAQHAELWSPLTYQRVYVAMGVEIGQLPSASRIGMCSGNPTDNSKYDCCDLLVNGSGTALVEAATTSAGQVRLSWPGSVSSGARVEITQDTVGSSNACRFVQNTSDAAQSCTKDGAKGHVVLWSESASVRFRYLFVAQIGP